MIVRDHLQCATCDAPHTVRVGAGQEERHSHRFSCKGCGEEIGIALVTRRDPVGVWVEAENNAIMAPARTGAPIINLDANFLIPTEQQGIDFVMPRLQQQHAMLNAILAAGGHLPEASEGAVSKADYSAEWDALRKAWSLERNKEGVLVRAQVKKINATTYTADPVNGVADWLWRFSTRLTRPAYEPLFAGAQALVEPLHGSQAMIDLRKHYAAEMAPRRGAKYLKVMREYFAAYSEFAQLQFLISAGAKIPASHEAASSGFAQTQMFYGNAYEIQGDLVDLLALLNNIQQGRAFDAFASLPTLKKYYELDKSSRAGPFSANATLNGFVSEADNQLRNASHHGGIEFDPKTRLLHCRSGKGGQGAERTLTYTEYLSRCVQLFMQVMSLYRLELVLATQFRLPPPL